MQIFAIILKSNKKLSISVYICAKNKVIQKPLPISDLFSGNVRNENLRTLTSYHQSAFGVFGKLIVRLFFIDLFYAGSNFASERQAL
jgi:hypothetical protein